MKSSSAIASEVNDSFDFAAAKNIVNPLTGGAFLAPYEEFAPYPDYAILPDWVAEFADFGAASVTVSRVDEYSLLLDAVGGRLTARYTKQEWEFHKNMIIAHEGDHARAAYEIGNVVGVRFGVLAVSDGNPVYYTDYAFGNGSVTKLALGSLYAAPKMPSPIDSSIVHAIGYTNQADIANRIIFAKDPRLHSLRIPTGYDPVTILPRALGETP